MFRRGRKGTARSGLAAFIDQGSEIEGKYTFSGTVMLNGKFKGEIATNDTLIVGEKGVINADIRAGQVTGAEEGVLFEGHCQMTKVNQIPEVPIARDFSVVPLKR